MLTHQQHRTMLFIEAYQARSGGVSPSVREIACHLGHKGRTEGVRRLLDGLEERGFIKRLRRRARALEVVKPVSRFAFMSFSDEAKALCPYASASNAENAQVGQT